MHIACQGTRRRDPAQNPFAHMTHAGLGEGGEAGSYSPVNSTGPQAELGEAVRAVQAEAAGDRELFPGV